MKLWIFSDLHLDIGPFLEPMPIPDADVCVVAGDILTRGIVPSIRWLEENVGRHMPVIFVAGNHEFYRDFFVESLVAASASGGMGGVRFLENESIIIGDVIFLGATLWTDFAILGENWSSLAMRNAARDINDFKLINYQRKPYSGFHPIHAYRRHVESREFLSQKLNENRDRKVVIVTHHAISLRSVETRFLDDLLTPAFASDLEALIADRGPSLWVHGHVHHRCDYRIAGTRIVCNPRGYPGEASAHLFDPAFVVDV